MTLRVHFRQCHKRDGEPKTTFSTFDDAMTVCAATASREKRMHPYRCEPCGGWHVGTNKPMERA